MRLAIYFCFIFLSLPSVTFASNFKKVVWVIFENENSTSALNQPDFKKYASLGVLFTNFFAESHPSQGNYIAMIAGSNFGVKLDLPVNLPHTHVGDLLEAKGLSWRTYAEDYPSNCFTAPQSGLYVRKHVPFMSFVNVSRNPTRCGFIQDEKNFDRDFTNGTLPEFSMYIPNMKNDGHDTSVDYAGKWLTQRFGSIISNPEGMGDVLFILTFDESEHNNPANQIYTVLLGANIKAGINSQRLNHPALLKLIEKEFELGSLNREDEAAPDIVGIWK